MLILKIPLAALIYIVWWAIKQEPEQPESTDDQGGGGLKKLPHDRHPRPPFPRHPRRGPHGDPPTRSPTRVRTVKARARTFEH